MLGVLVVRMILYSFPVREKHRRPLRLLSSLELARVRGKVEERVARLVPRAMLLPEKEAAVAGALGKGGVDGAVSCAVEGLPEKAVGTGFWEEFVPVPALLEGSLANKSSRAEKLLEGNFGNLGAGMERFKGGGTGALRGKESGDG